MSYFKFILKIIFLTLTVSLSALADTERLATFGSWSVEKSGNYYEAYTVNGAGSSLGMVCGAELCFYYFGDENRNCKAGDRYSALVNGDFGAFTIQSECVVTGSSSYEIIDKEYFQSIHRAVTKGDTVGFASAIDNGKFEAVYFNLSGSEKAISYATELNVENISANKGKEVF